MTRRKHYELSKFLDTPHFKTEVIEHERPVWLHWRDVEKATASWVHWYNHERLHSSIGDVPPAEYEDSHYHSTRGQQAPAAA